MHVGLLFRLIYPSLQTWTRIIYVEKHSQTSPSWQINVILFLNRHVDENSFPRENHECFKPCIVTTSKFVRTGSAKGFPLVAHTVIDALPIKTSDEGGLHDKL